MCEKQLSMNTCAKYLVNIFKTVGVCHFEHKKYILVAIYGDFGIVPISKFVRLRPDKKCSDVIFAFLTKTVQKYVSGHPNPKFYVWPFFEPVTSDDLDLTPDHQGLRRILRSTPDTIHVSSSTLF